MKCLRNLFVCALSFGVLGVFTIEASASEVQLCMDRSNGDVWIRSACSQEEKQIVNHAPLPKEIVRGGTNQKLELGTHGLGGSCVRKAHAKSISYYTALSKSSAQTESKALPLAKLQKKAQQMRKHHNAKFAY